MPVKRQKNDQKVAKSARERAREHFPKNRVHGHFQCSREKKSSEMSTYQPKGFFKKVLDENSKIVLPVLILKKKIQTPNFTKFLNPQRNVSALFYLYRNLS